MNDVQFTIIFEGETARIDHNLDYRSLFFRKGLGLEPEEITADMVDVVCWYLYLWDANVLMAQTFKEVYAEAIATLQELSSSDLDKSSETP